MTRWRRMLEVLAAVAGASWGAVAGGLAFAGVAFLLGAPTGTGPGEIIPGFGWNRFTAFIVGLPVGAVAGGVAARRAARRWPGIVGVPLAIVGALAVVSAVADPSGWDWLPIVYGPAAAAGVVLFLWRRRQSTR